VPVGSTSRVLAADDRLDEAVVAVSAPVEHADPFGLGVDEEEERVAELVHARQGVLLEHRLDREALDLDDLALPIALGGAVGDAAQDRLLLVRAGADARLLLEIDQLSLELVDDDVDAGLVRYRRGVPMERPTARDEGHVHEVRVLGAAVVLHGKLDDGVALIVEQSLQTLHLSLGMAANVIRHLEVLALDDRLHEVPPCPARCARVARRGPARRPRARRPALGSDRRLPKMATSRV
jgi:hypothetical protein